MSQYDNERKQCDTCFGSGKKYSYESISCPECKGNGKIIDKAWDTNKKMTVTFPRTCKVCNGKGATRGMRKDDSTKCEACNGLKYVVRKKSIEDYVPIGGGCASVLLLGAIIFATFFGLYRCASGLFE